MSGNVSNNIVKRIVDTAMTILLLLLMAYQVTGEAAHEWIGMGMTVLVIIHQILNRRWYAALFRGKYNPYRFLSTAVNILLLLSFLMTAFCGMSMSGYAVPFMYGLAPVSFVRKMHLSLSHWAFVLMGLHLGMHIPAMTAGLKWNDRTKAVLTGLFTIAGGIGLYLFLRNGMPDYLFFRISFAFLDYEKAGLLVLIENLLMLSFWALIGTQLFHICRNAAGKAASKRNPLLPLVIMMAAVIIGILIKLLAPSGDDAGSFGNTRGIAQEIQSQTGADLFEITPEDPYSEDYNTVLMQAQEDQHKQARPKLSEHIQNMDEYDIILLGYPNWWASIPMPIASFLEEYDFSGKTIIPFCSHGGGRFGQSLTAIAKLAPDSLIGQGLSVHYSGGSSLPDDVTAWLKANGISR